jgi:hypothetical protein
MAKKRPTKLERERLQAVASLPCYACFIDGIEMPSEVHHIRSQTGLGLRPSHFATIPLCSKHHRTGKVSVHLGKKAFIEKYGTEQEILENVNREIENDRKARIII